jgi:hypothetical protein
MTLIEQLLVEQFWLAPLIWAALHISDYLSTLATARLHAAAAGQVIQYEGGIELTPQFREDIRRLRLFSPRFALALLYMEILILAIWLLSTRLLWVPQSFLTIAGGLIFLEAVIHMRHLRNYFIFWHIRKYGQPSGRIYYPRWMMLKASALELASFGLLFLVAWALHPASSLAGGAVFCLAAALRHWLWGRREQRKKKEE